MDHPKAKSIKTLHSLIASPRRKGAWSQPGRACKTVCILSGPGMQGHFFFQVRIVGTGMAARHVTTKPRFQCRTRLHQGGGTVSDWQRQWPGFDLTSPEKI